MKNIWNDAQLHVRPIYSLFPACHQTAMQSTQQQIFLHKVGDVELALTLYLLIPWFLGAVRYTQLRYNMYCDTGCNTICVTIHIIADI